MGLPPDPGGIVTRLDSRSEQISRTADKIERQHPEWSRIACLSLAEEIVSEYDADRSAVSGE